MALEDNLMDIYRELDRIQDRVAESTRMAQLTSMRSNIGRPHTIAADTISPGANEFIILTPQTGNTDDLSTINDGRAQRQIALRTGDPAYTITLKDGVDNIDLGGSDIVLDSASKVIVLVYDAELVAWIRLGLDSASTFVGLPDTPASYAGDTLKHVRVNAGETALEFVAHTTPAVINFGGIEVLTISGGSVTRSATSSFYAIESEIGAADNLDTIAGGSDGDMIVIRPVSGDTITVTEAGNIQCVGTTRTLDNVMDKFTCIYDASASKWCEISQAGNA